MIYERYLFNYISGYGGISFKGKSNFEKPYNPGKNILSYIYDLAFSI